MTIEETLQAIVHDGGLVGTVALIWRSGEIVHLSCTGWQDDVGGRPIRQDTLFRIASMSKPITTVAALTLLEEGRFKLEDPITRWAPEFESMTVLRDRGDLEDVTSATREITFDDLLTHRSGITYGDFHVGPLAAAYAEGLGRQIDSHLSPAEWIENLASLPLIDQPGSNFHYGHSTDLLGLLMERIEDAPLSEVLKRRVFEPLGMVDTGFAIPPDQKGRCAANHGFDDLGRRVILTDVPGDHALADRPPELTFFSGGQGLWSTIDDYLRFARIFVEGGAVDGIPILKRGTLELMTTNHLSDRQRASAEMLGMHPFAEGHGYGFGVAVVMNPEAADPTISGGGMGAVGWPGAYGSWWQADPNNRSIMILLTHNMVTLDQLANGIGFGVWDAITELQRLGSTAQRADPSRN